VQYIASDPVQQYFLSLPVNQQNNPNLQQQFTTACTDTTDPKNPKPRTCYVSVYPADRLQFFRYYGGGLRFAMYAPDPSHSGYRFPGNLDLTVGQNEYVTGGSLHGMVFHIGGTIPVPGVDYAYINLGMDTSLTKSHVSSVPLLLTPGSATTIDPATVVNVQQPQPNRDRYTVGISFDIAHLIAKSKGPEPPVIATQPVGGKLISGTLQLNVDATASGQVSYQWYKGSQGDVTQPQPDGTGSTFDAVSAGTYWVRVTNTVNSNSATKDSNAVAVVN